MTMRIKLKVMQGCVLSLMILLAVQYAEAQEKTSVPAVAAEAAAPQRGSFIDTWRGQHKKAPAFVAYDPDGNAYTLADFNGKTVVLDFWGRYCAKCIKGFPDMQYYAAKYADQGLVIVAMDASNKQPDFDYCVADFKYRYPDLVFLHDRLVDTEGYTKGYANVEFKINSLPSMVIIDKDGIVADVSAQSKHRVLLALAETGMKIDQADIDKAEAAEAREDEERKSRKDR